MGEDINAVTLCRTYADENGEGKERQATIPASMIQIECSYQTLDDDEIHTEVITMQDIAERGEEIKRLLEVEDL